MVLHQQQRDGIYRGAQRRGLLEYVDAVFVALDHPRDAANLAFHAREPTEQLRAILGVAMARRSGMRRGMPAGPAGASPGGGRSGTGGCSGVAHTGGEYKGRSLNPDVILDGPAGHSDGR